MLLIAILLFLTLTVAITVFGYIHYVKPTRMLDQLASTTSDAIPGLGSERQGQGELSLTELLAPLGGLLPISPQDAAITRGDLISAGFRSTTAVASYYGSKLLLSAVLVLVALAVRSHLESAFYRTFAP